MAFGVGRCVQLDGDVSCQCEGHSTCADVMGCEQRHQTRRRHLSAQLPAHHYARDNSSSADSGLYSLSIHDSTRPRSQHAQLLTKGARARLASLRCQPTTAFTPVETSCFYGSRATTYFKNLAKSNQTPRAESGPLVPNYTCRPPASRCVA